MKPKKRRPAGHRQEITRLMINSISLNGSVLTSEEAAADEAQWLLQTWLLRNQQLNRLVKPLWKSAEVVQTAAEPDEQQ